MRSQSFVITGMTCANCVNTVSKTLNQSDKIVEATVNLATEKAKIVADDSLTDQEIINLVEKAGYGAIVNDKAHQEKIARQAARKARNLSLSFPTPSSSRRSPPATSATRSPSAWVTSTPTAPSCWA